MQLKLHADARLAAAVGGVARYFADAAGMESEPCTQLQLAVVTACQESFEHFANDGTRLDVTLVRFADRIEISLTYAGTAAPAVGLHTIAGFPGLAGGSGKSALDVLDRVEFETRESSATTRLTKFLGPSAPAQ